MAPAPSLSTIQTRVDQVLIDLRTLRQENKEEHGEFRKRLVKAETWQARCEGKSEGRREWSGRLVGLLVMAGTLLAGLGAVIGAYAR